MTNKTSKPLRFCPICEGSMAIVSTEGVTVDICADHGVFLDHGELVTLERRAHRGVRIGLHASVAEDMRNPFRQPIADPDKPRSAAQVLSALLSVQVRAPHRPEQSNVPEPPALDRSNQEVVPDGMRGCPQCNRVMVVDERKDVWGRTETVLVDTCEEHGVWLDHSELAILLDRSNQDARRNARRHRLRAIEAAKFRARAQNN